LVIDSARFIHINTWTMALAVISPNFVFWMLLSFFWVILRRLIFCADVSEHCSIFIGKHHLWKWTRVFRNAGTQNSDAGESPSRKTTTFRTRRKFEIERRVHCWIHFVRWFIVRRQNFPGHLVHTNFVGCVSEIENRASRNCKPRSGLLSFYSQPRRCMEAQVRLLETVYKAICALVERACDVCVVRHRCTHVTK